MNYCMDCPHYAQGGRCVRHNKVVSALAEQCNDRREGTSRGEKIAEARSKDTKICTKCGRELPIENFAKSSKTIDGRQGHCKDCNHQAYKDWRKRHPKSAKKNIVKDYGNE